MFLLVSACQGVDRDSNGLATEYENVAEQSAPGSSYQAYTAIGYASYYADALHGRPTASGEAYDTAAFTAAHMELPFDTNLQIINLSTADTVQVRINDRGPYHSERIIDLSKAAAKALHMLEDGIAEVRIEEISPDEK